jgi:hypothetical protein
MSSLLQFCRRSALFTAALVPALLAAELRPSFEALPAETMVAGRIDNSPEILDAYRANTRLGEVLLSEKMAADFKAALEEALEETEAGQNFKGLMENFGLELEDLISLSQGQFGGAVINQPVDDEWNMPTFLVWVDGDPEVIGKTYGSILQAIEESEDHSRTDEKTGGFTISRVRVASTGSSFLIAKLENRIHFAMGYPLNGAIQDDEDNVAHEVAEFNMLGRFMVAAQGSGGGFLEEIQRDPAIAAHAFSSARLEILGSIPRLLANSSEAERIYHGPLGVGRLRAFGAWARLEGSREEFTAVLGIDRPVAGLAKLLDLEPTLISPPEWVPSDVMTYAEMTFDLPRIYEVAKEIAGKMTRPEIVEAQLGQVDQQLQQTVQTDLAGLLGSFGKRVYYIDYPPVDTELDFGNGDSITIPSAQQVMVVDFSRPDILENAMELSGAVMNNPNSMISRVDELGFQGLRFAAPGNFTTVAYGAGKVLFAVGEGVETRAFSLLRNPPEETNALANDSRFREFLAAESPKPALALQYIDGRRAFAGVHSALNSMSEMFAVAGVFGPYGMMNGVNDSSEGSVMEPFLSLLPEEEVLETLIRYIYSRMALDDTGLVLELDSVLE